MQRSGTRIRLGVLVVIGMAVLAASPFATQPLFAQETPSPQLARKIGAIKSISGNSLTLTPDSGTDVAVTVQPNARILKIAPGEKDLKNATPMQVQDLQVGDRVRVRGQAAADGAGIAALEIIVMARTDLEAKHQQEQQDWQKRGLGGLVKEVDPNSGTVTVSVTGVGGTRSLSIRTSGTTIFRRYAPDSVKFDDAKPSTIQEIHAGDQLRARGDRSPDGAELTADEVVSGSFRNVAGTVNSVDASSNTVTVQDLLSKKPVVVKITPESQLHKLPPEMAQMIAMRLKGGMPPGAPGAGGVRPGGSVAGNASPTGGSQAAKAEGAPQNGAAGGPGPGGPGTGGPGGGMGRRSAGDFQQMLNRMPPVAIADLHKGDAVLIVATQGTASGSTAITLLSGVEPILQAAPSQAMMLTPWSLGGAPGGDASQ